MSSLRIVERAWAAGLFDGEGTAYTYRRASKNRLLKLTVAQSDRRVLDRFRRAVEAGRVYGPYGPYRTQSRPYFQWQTTTLLDAQAAASRLLPFLSPVKRRQIQKAAR